MFKPTVTVATVGSPPVAQPATFADQLAANTPPDLKQTRPVRAPAPRVQATPAARPEPGTVLPAV